MTELEQELLKLISDLRAENAALTEVVLAQAGLNLVDKEIVVPEAQQYIGRTPWYRKKSMLESLYKSRGSHAESKQIPISLEEDHSASEE